jgi:hypothetical protein
MSGPNHRDLRSGCLELRFPGKHAQKGTDPAIPLRQSSPSLSSAEIWKDNYGYDEWLGWVPFGSTDREAQEEFSTAYSYSFSFSSRVRRHPEALRTASDKKGFLGLFLG